MVELNWTLESERWLRDIFNYISKDNPQAASKVIESIYKTAQILKKFPESGYIYKQNQSQHIRILLYGHYRIAYLIKPDRNIDILGVFHGSLDMDRYLMEDNSDL
ncbi:MAG: type II toxin-antitoxin system RelE/ParE family toxin [Candidatus Methanoperedenaceae archaeon]|nr:type II toxin-antitoxin system RelE/ParE family toxin [Candidatus Methanoperedenaceae archaeon]